MALDHHGRAWVAAIVDGRIDEALERVAQGRAGLWSATRRDGHNALVIAGRHGSPALVEALARAGARAVHPQAIALLDWLERGDRASLDAYERGVPAGVDPYPGLEETIGPTGEAVLVTALIAAMRHGWTDRAHRWWPTEPGQMPGWNDLLTRLAQNAVGFDRPEQLDWLDQHASVAWDRVPHPGQDLAPRHEGNLLVLAAERDAARVIPWLLDHGVAPDGHLPPDPNAPAGQPSRTTIRPWLHALERDSTHRQAGQAWASSPTARWLDAWLADPRVHPVIGLSSGRFGKDLLQRLIQRDDLERVDRLLTLHDAPVSVLDADPVTMPSRWAEHTAMEHGNPVLLDRVLQRSRAWPMEIRRATLSAAFDRWTQALPDDRPETRTAVLAQRTALLQVLVQHGWDLNAPEVQVSWATTRRPLAQETVLGPARAAGWDPRISAQAWPDGPEAYALTVMNALFARGTHQSKTVEVPDADRPVWASRWFGTDGWLRDALTPRWWQRAWEDGTAPSPSSLRIDWLMDSLPDQVLDPAAMLKGLQRWSQFHGSSENDPGDQHQRITLERWLARFAAMVPPDHPGTVTMMQQLVWDERHDWLDRWHETFPQAIQGVSPTRDSQPAMLRKLAGLGVNLHRPGALREPLLDEWLRERHQALPTGTVSPAQRRAFLNKVNAPGLCALLRAVGPDRSIGYRATDQTPAEPLIVYAARTQDWDLVDLLRRAGANVNAADERGCTALAYAVALHDRPVSRAWQGHWPMDEDRPSEGTWAFGLIEVVRTLLDAGASVQARIPGKDRTVERALTNPRHHAWLNSDRNSFVAVERALMRNVMAGVPASPSQDVPTPRRRL